MCCSSRCLKIVLFFIPAIHNMQVSILVMQTDEQKQLSIKQTANTTLLGGGNDPPPDGNPALVAAGKICLLHPSLARPEVFSFQLRCKSSLLSNGCGSPPTRGQLWLIMLENAIWSATVVSFFFLSLHAEGRWARIWHKADSQKTRTDTRVNAWHSKLTHTLRRTPLKTHLADPATRGRQEVRAVDGLGKEKRERGGKMMASPPEVDADGLALTKQFWSICNYYGDIRYSGIVWGAQNCTMMVKDKQTGI